jgi:uncharacterized protein (TIGR04255 family)
LERTGIAARVRLVLFFSSPNKSFNRMRPKNLPNKPLIEAILELKWKPPFFSSSSLGVDGDLRLFLGRFHDAVREQYPAFEILPTAAAPEQAAPNLPQYRFRQIDGGWPLVQLGSGLLALNDTAAYTWKSFRERAKTIATLVFETYPTKLEATSLELRYINAVYVDFEKHELFTQIAEKFRIPLSFPPSLFDGTGVSNRALLFGLQSAFPTKSPLGSLRFTISRGRANDRDAILWETIVHTAEKELPTLPTGFLAWLDAAHKTAEEWFFRLVEGELLEQFSGGLKTTK